jgi:serine protease SohB
MLAAYGLFALKITTTVIAILCLVGGIIALTKKRHGKLEVISLNKHKSLIKEQLTKELHQKKSKEKIKKTKVPKPSLFLLDFVGDIKASQVEELRHEITAIINSAQKDDEVLLRLESGGGTVNGYGLAAAQLQRLREKNIKLTVAIDKIAASGGYLMACVANEIIAAPFAIVGSIGVVAQLPNFHKLLKKHNIDVELLTAGEHKRTLTIFGENTTKGRKKFQEDLEQVHTNFTNHILSYRKKLDLKKIATGEHWLAIDAKELALIDNLQTSDDYIDEKLQKFNVFEIRMERKKPSLLQKLSLVAQEGRMLF